MLLNTNPGFTLICKGWREWIKFHDNNSEEVNSSRKILIAENSQVNQSGERFTPEFGGQTKVCLWERPHLALSLRIH